MILSRRLFSWYFFADHRRRFRVHRVFFFRLYLSEYEKTHIAVLPRLLSRMFVAVNIDLLCNWRHGEKTLEKETSTYPFCRNILAIVEQRWNVARTQHRATAAILFAFEDDRSYSRWRMRIWSKRNFILDAFADSVLCYWTIIWLSIWWFLTLRILLPQFPIIILHILKDHNGFLVFSYYVYFFIWIATNNKCLLSLFC